jgi:hypothetical protein
MIISRPRIEEQGRELRAVSTIRFADGTARDLWFSLPATFGEGLLEANADPFLMALLQEAMLRGEDIRVEGSLSKRLWFNAERHLQPMMQLLRYKLSRVRIEPEALRDDATMGTGAGLAFSGGVDSFYALLDHHAECDDPLYRVTHLFIASVGAILDLDWTARQAQMRAVAEMHGIGAIPIASNLNELLTLPLVKSHTLRTMSCPALLPRLFRRVYLASGYNYHDIKPNNYYLSPLEPAFVHLLSTAQTEMILTGAQHSRIHKTQRIADLPSAQRHLNVCVSPITDRNCSRCWKCTRTEFTLEMYGKLDKFDQAFDLDVWKKVRSAYVGEWLLNRNKRRITIVKEVQQLARERGYAYSRWERFLGVVASTMPKRVYDRIALSGRADLLPPTAGDAAEPAATAARQPV